MWRVLLTLLAETPPPRPHAAEFAESVELKMSSTAMRPDATGVPLRRGKGGREGGNRTGLQVRVWA